jgi:hypothetical protein
VGIGHRDLDDELAALERCFDLEDCEGGEQIIEAPALGDAAEQANHAVDGGEQHHAVPPQGYPAGVGPQPRGDESRLMGGDVLEHSEEQDRPPVA